jgi:isopentenyl-diphosphate delta-isomerase
MEAAVQRRLFEELGLRCPLRFLYKFRYQAQFDTLGAEQELCSVFIGRSTHPVAIDRREIHAWRWMAPQALQAEMGAQPGRFTPWFILEWQRVWGEHRNELGLI